MDTFFIPPLIPYKIYLIIKKFKNKEIFNESELNLIGNLEILYDYSQKLDDNTVNNIINIVNKIDTYKNSNLKDKLVFIKQNDYNEITTYNYLIYSLLLQRNYIQIINAKQTKLITTSFGLSDIGPISDTQSSFNNLNENEKLKYIDDFIKYSDTKKIIHDIMAKSQITSKINTLTRILSNKSILYNLLEGEDFIPISYNFNINDNDIKLQTILDNFKNNNKSEYFVIKPSSGTLSDGLVIKLVSELNINFIKEWTSNPDNNIYSNSDQYTTWILSSFIKSFLWKLNGPSNTSNFFKEQVPELEKHEFNDSNGRINKFRFWCLWTIIDGKFTSYLYKNGYSELSLEELTNYSKTQLDPSNIELYYQELLNVSEDKDAFEDIQLNKLKDSKLEASTVGTYLDFARVVNENNYPLGQKSWNNIVIPEMYKIVNTILEKTKRHINCINKNNNIKNNSGCYSYFALDILIDSNNKPWLLEANSKPFVGFSDWWNKYDPNNNHCLNSKSFFNNILSLTVDKINGTNNIPNTIEDFLITKEYNIKNKSKNYIPFTLGLTDSSTNKIYNDLYNILDSNNYSSFPYANYEKSGVGFKGLSPISKYLISKIDKLGKEHVLSLLRYLYPGDAKQKMLNKIMSLGFYLGDKSQLTIKIKENNNDWNNIIPWSIVYDKTNINQSLNSLLKDMNFTFICKPALGQQGQDILISNNINEIQTHINDLNYDSWLISKYLDNPYLIKINKIGVSNINYNDSIGRKSHMRVYVLLHQKQGKLNAYMYKKSLIFSAAKEYNTCDEDSKYFCNLTNLYYGGLYYSKLGKEPNDAYKDLSNITNEILDNDTYNILMKKVKVIVQKTILSVKGDLICLNYNNDCFQYIAFDFHLENEDTIRPWLLEVNSTPGLKAPNYQFKESGGIHNYLENILNLTLDTKISKGNKQLFEFISFKKSYKDSLIIDELNKPFNNITDCMVNNSYFELKQLLIEKNIPGRSKLTTKEKMCKKLINKI